MDHRSTSLCLATICLQFASVISGSGIVLFLTGAAAASTLIYNILKSIQEYDKVKTTWRQRWFGKKAK